VIPTRHILDVLERHPDGITTDQCSSALGVLPKQVSGRLSKLHAYGLIRKMQQPMGRGHGMATWLPKGRP
jgi:predicted ArsR family transcriptional regulator